MVLVAVLISTVNIMEMFLIIKADQQYLGKVIVPPIQEGIQALAFKGTCSHGKHYPK